MGLVLKTLLILFLFLLNLSNAQEYKTGAILLTEEQLEKVPYGSLWYAPLEWDILISFFDCFLNSTGVSPLGLYFILFLLPFISWLFFHPPFIIFFIANSEIKCIRETIII